MDTDALILAARVFMMALFVMTGWQKLTAFTGTVGYMKSSGVPWPALATTVSIVAQFLFGIGVILGIYTRVLAGIFGLILLAVVGPGHYALIGD